METTPYGLKDELGLYRVPAATVLNLETVIGYLMERDDFVEPDEARSCRDMLHTTQVLTAKIKAAIAKKQGSSTLIEGPHYVGQELKIEWFSSLGIPETGLVFKSCDLPRSCSDEKTSTFFGSIKGQTFCPDDIPPSREWVETLWERFWYD